MDCKLRKIRDIMCSHTGQSVHDGMVLNSRCNHKLCVKIIKKIASNSILKRTSQLANNSQLDDASSEPEIILTPNLGVLADP